MSAAADTGSTARRAYLRRESALSIVINSVLSLAFFLGVFGIDPRVPVPIGGMGGYAFDFLPQSFMIALMSTLVPGAITAARVRGGRIGGLGETAGALAMRSLLTAVMTLAPGGLVGFLLMAVVGDAAIPWLAALIVKIVYGAALAAFITPVGLRRALRRAAFS